jgi:hypothetical protein
MSKSPSAIQTYAGLAPVARHLIQLCAVCYEGVNSTGLVKLSNQVGWTDAAGKPLVFNRAKSDINRLL